MVIRKMGDSQRLSLLPGGEGQDEGERSNKLCRFLKDHFLDYS